MRLTARDELVISVIIVKADGPAGHSNDSQNGCFAVTSKFVNTPTLVYKVSRSYSDFLKLRDELEKILPGNLMNNESSIPNQATILEAFLRKAATFVEIKTSIQFASFLSSVNFIAFSSNSSKSLKSLPNTYEENLDPSKGKQFSAEEIREYISKQEKCMTAMVSAASTLVKPTSKLAGALSDLKEGFMCLGHLDIDDAKNEEAFHSNQYLEVIVSTLAKVSKESLSTADMYTIDFIEPLVEYSRMLKSITTAINQWASKKKHYNKMIAELENKSGTASQILLLSKQEFDRATNRLVTDFIDFRRRRIVDFRRIMGNFIQLQMAYHGSSNDLWNAALVSCAELEGLASSAAINKASNSVPKTVTPKSMQSSVASSAMKSVVVELQHPQNPNSNSRKTLLVPESLFTATDDIKTRVDNVERLKSIILSKASFSKGHEDELQFYVYCYGNGISPSTITETATLSTQPVIPLDAYSLTELAMQTTIQIKLIIKEQQQQRQQQHFISQEVEAERLQVSNNPIANREPVYGEGILQHLSLSSESDVTIRSSSSSSDSGLIKASSSGDSMVSKWDANPLRNISNNTNKSSSESSKYGSIGSSNTVTTVAMRERNLNNDLFKRHETNPLKLKPSRLSSSGIRTSEFNNSPSTQEPGFGLHIGASYIKQKDKDTEDPDVVKYCEDHGLLKLDGLTEGNSASFSSNSSYGSTIQNNNMESVFGSACEQEVGTSASKGPVKVTDSQSSDSFSWGSSASLSMSISISESSQGYRSISGDYSSHTLSDENDAVASSEDLARKSLYFLRAQKDVLEVSPVVSTYSRSASIDEWSSPLSPGSRGVYTYNASVEFINDESPIKRTSLTSDLGAIETPNQYSMQRKQVISLQSQQKSICESDRQHTQSQPSPRYSISETTNNPFKVASSSDLDRASIESENIDTSSKNNNASIDTGSLQWDSNPFRRMSIKRSGCTADPRKVASPPRAPLLPKAGEGSSSTQESLDQIDPPAMLNTPVSSFVVEVGKDTQSTPQQNISSIQSRQPVVSAAAATSNLLEPSTVSDNSSAALEANSPKISEEDLLKWDANPLRNKSSRPSISGSTVRPENTTPGSNKFLSSIVLADSGSRQSLLSNKGPPSRLKGGFSPAGSPVPSVSNPQQQVDSGRTVPLKPVLRTTSPNPLAVESKPSEIRPIKSPMKPSLAASLFSVIEEPSLSKSSVAPANINKLTPSGSEERRAYSLPKEANVNLQDAFSASQLAASMSKDLLSELSLEPLTSETVPIPQSSGYRSPRFAASPVRPTPPWSTSPISSPLPIPATFPSSKNPSPTPMARVTRTTEEQLNLSAVQTPIVLPESASPLQPPLSSIRDAHERLMKSSNSSSHEVKSMNSPPPSTESAKAAPLTTPKSDPSNEDPDFLKWDANPLRNKSKRAAIEESATPDKPTEKAVIGSNKLLSSMLLYDNAGKDIRANLQNKSMLVAKNKGILTPPNMGTRQSPIRTPAATDSATPSHSLQSILETAAVSTPVAPVQPQKLTTPIHPLPVVASIPVVTTAQRPIESNPLTIETSTTEAEKKVEASATERNIHDVSFERQKSTGLDSIGSPSSDSSAPVMARLPSQVRAQAQSQAAQAISSPGPGPTAAPAAAVTSPNSAPTNNNKFLSSIVIGNKDQWNPLSKTKSNSILANRQKGDSTRPTASVPALDGGQPDASSSSLLLRPRKPVEDLSASFGFDDLSSKSSVSLSPSQPTSQHAPTKEAVDLTSAEVAAKWDLNPLRSTSKKKTNIVS